MMGIRRIRFEGSVFVLGNDRISGTAIIILGWKDYALYFFQSGELGSHEKFAIAIKHDNCIHLLMSLKVTYLSQPTRSGISTG